MTGKQKNQQAVQEAVAEVLNKHQARWQDVVELRKRYGQLKDNLVKIGEYEAVLKKKIAPLKEKAMNSRRILVEQVFPVSSVLGVFSYDTGDKKLDKLAKVKFSDLEKSSDESLMKYCRKILKIAGVLLDQKKGGDKKESKKKISDYGLASGHLDKIRSALDEWKKNNSEYIALQKQKKKSKSRLSKTIRENNQILKNKIDRMMQLFRESQKTFYNSYINARIPEEPVSVVKEKPGSTKKAAKAAVKTAEPAVPAAESGAEEAVREE
jgi:hypothetical protein